MKKPVVLIILDGFGIRDEVNGNAVLQAKMPNYQKILDNYPQSQLEASGKAVGLPAGQMGSSEVGHLNIGAGRVVYQSLEQINKAIEDNSFYQNKAILTLINNCKKNNSYLHLIGMVSDGQVHSHIEHLYAILDLCKKENFDRVYIHAILDGRDTEPLVAPKYINQLENKIKELGIGKIITIQGRYYIMNRDRNWDLTKLSYDAIIDGISQIKVTTIEEAFQKEYSENLTDEFMKPTVIESIPIKENDSIFAFNFRSDRMIQFSRALLDPNFKEFKRTRGQIKPLYGTMTEYESESYYSNVLVAFEKDFLSKTLGEILESHHLRQLHLTEYEKRLHVTFYFNGSRLEPYQGQVDQLFERPNVFTYDEQPSMRSVDITKYLIDSINSQKYDFIIVNYPNGDALGHTGIMEAAIQGVEFLDSALGDIITKTNLDDYYLLITADHGNCEYMIDPDGTPNKKHTTNPVPFIICNQDYKLKNGKLGDIAPTVLELLEIDKPEEMTGNSLLIKK